MSNTATATTPIDPMALGMNMTLAAIVSMPSAIHMCVSTDFSTNSSASCHFSLDILMGPMAPPLVYCLLCCELLSYIRETDKGVIVSLKDTDV